MKFILQEGSAFSKSDYPIPIESLITIIGNLIDNAFDAMNEIGGDFDKPKELLFGIFSKRNSLIITVNDTGVGIKQENIEKVFQNGYSTKGEGRGTGLFQVKQMVENLNGEITLKSEYNTGTSITVCLDR